MGKTVDLFCPTLLILLGQMKSATFDDFGGVAVKAMRHKFKGLGPISGRVLKQNEIFFHDQQVYNYTDKKENKKNSPDYLKNDDISTTQIRMRFYINMNRNKK